MSDDAKYWKEQASAWHQDFDKLVTYRDRLLAERDTLAEALDDLIHDARLIRQCEEFDNCDVCKAEQAVRVEQAEGAAA